MARRLTATLFHTLTVYIQQVSPSGFVKVVWVSKGNCEEVEEGGEGHKTQHGGVEGGYL